MGTACDLNRLERDAFLLTGDRVHLAPAQPGDEDRIADFYRRLSDVASYFRFFTVRHAIPHAELETLTSDPAHCLAILATVDDVLIGVGEYHVEASDHDEAEIAFAVGDHFQHQGVATLILEDLAVIAKHMGLRRLVAHTLVSNEAMKLVLRTIGLAESHRYEDGVVTFTLDLAELDGLVAAAALRAGTPGARARMPDDSFGPLR
jgi:RimJ/RimL family protein N-acetyltransferase